MFIYFPDTMAVQAVELLNPPSPRVFAALIVLDSNRLLLFGGQSYVNSIDVFQDAYTITFSDETFKYATSTAITIENPDCFPPTVYANSRTTDRVIIVSRPRDCTKVCVDSQYLRRLFSYGIASNHFFNAKPIIPVTRLCLGRPTESRQQLTTSYPKPIKNHGSASAFQCFQDSKDSFCEIGSQHADFTNTLHFAWHDTAKKTEDQRNMTLFPDDYAYVMQWFSEYHPTEQCYSGRRGGHLCYRPGACMYKSIKIRYQTNDEEFLNRLLNSMYQLYLLSRGGPIQDSAYLPLAEDTNCGDVQHGIFPLDRLLELQMLVPVHRVLTDVFLTSTFYTIDLEYVKQHNKIRFGQQTVPFNSWLLPEYAPIVVAGCELFTCGGVHRLPNEMDFSTRTFTGY
ncbi:unnamed protein product [Bursaphelenchus okinawaensis]|uniref:Uncharacterized protein n=1 Tax=Bursaphelenchus okinawaensis TaxID=465554 RepID=A0A811KLG1_9BILA|nr:unnamed protein product [Bursaphelenchus okinawaensis]CAG9105925.1 unnamed protein product [Bursaphelenchus okinawaensis]